MIQLAMPHLDQVSLVPVRDDPGMTVGEGEAGGEARRLDRDGPLSVPLHLGGPLSVPLTPSAVADDPDLVRFLEREKTRFGYSVAYLSLSVGARPLAPLETVAVDLRLTTRGEAMAPALAWAMAPDRVVDPAQLTDRFILGPQLSLLGVGASFGGVERGRGQKHTAVFLHALHVLRDDPGWHFFRTATMPIEGLYRLVMVVRSPRGIGTDIAVTVRATTSRGCWSTAPISAPISASTDASLAATG